jgi:hypothetical protein
VAADIERLKADAVLEYSGWSLASPPWLRRGPRAPSWWSAAGAQASIPTILLKELRVQGSFMYADEFAEVIALLTDRVLSEWPI